MLAVTETDLSLSEQLCNQGYLNLKHYLHEDTFQICESLGDVLAALPETVGGPMKYFERIATQQVVLNRVEQFIETSSPFADLIQHQFKPLLRQLTGQTFILFKDKINFKQPGAGGFKPHQDAPAFMKFIPAMMYIIAIPLQETDESNGCIYVADNGYQPKLAHHENGELTPKALQGIQWRPIRQTPGDILIFSSYLFHFSKENLSQAARRYFFLTFNLHTFGDKRDIYFQFKRSQFPPRIERDPNKSYSKWQKNLAREIL